MATAHAATSHPHSHKHVYSLVHTPTHTGDTQDVWSPKRSSQGPSLSRPQLTDIQHSSTPLRVTPANAVRGASMCVCVCVHACAGLNLGWFLDRVWKVCVHNYPSQNKDF